MTSFHAAALKICEDRTYVTGNKGQLIRVDHTEQV